MKDPFATHYGPFEGMDGRTTMSPPKRFTLHSPGAQPVRVYQAKRLIDNLVQIGFTNHSKAGAMLWVVLWWCDYHKKTYVLKCYGEGGAVLFLDNIQPGVHV